MGRRGRPPADDQLTPAEWRVVEAVRHGLSNPRIARLQGVSLDAVKFHVSNALLKLDLPNRQALRRWSGIRRSSRMSQERTVMSGLVEWGGLGQVARSVSDIEQSLHFYGEQLGLPLLYRFGALAFFDLAGVRLMLSQGEQTMPESILYLRVGDIYAACELLQARGVTLLNAPHLIHTHADGSEEWMAFFNDPDQRPLALQSVVAPSASAPAPD
ncbi:MAG: hypothetical protein KDI48_05780 [Xanthomonadales bacterium]|nr:hypothetical protein [Xanthomonadales bacterium]